MAASHGINDIDRIMNMTLSDLFAVCEGYDLDRVNTMEMMAQQTLMMRYTIWGKKVKPKKVFDHEKAIRDIDKKYSKLYGEKAQRVDVEKRQNHAMSLANLSIVLNKKNNK